MLRHEYIKIFSKKTIPGILLFLALVNAFLFYTELRTENPFLFDNIGPTADGSGLPRNAV
ncbi:MAG: hypothetical protein ACLSAP_00895 [Oscillospiraceae bacterium]